MLTTIICKIVSDAGLASPDGRPLHRYSLGEETFGQLEQALRSRIGTSKEMEIVAPAFVLWAAEHIRARFSGGQWSWAFVFEPLGLHSDDQNFGRELAEHGLRWWGREIRISDAGRRFFLYSLMAEGGIPEELLREQGLYRNVVMGLLSEIEAEGGPDSRPWAEQIASRWTLRLPQTFQNDDIVRLLAELALALAELRAGLPSDLPEGAAERWLNQNRPNWTSTIPLRMTPEIAKSLIRPALTLDAQLQRVSTGPLCRRELWRDEKGCWHGYLILNDNGWLPVRTFPHAADMRLNLLPTGTEIVTRIRYGATPEGEGEGKGWRLQCFLGAVQPKDICFSPEKPFTLAAFVDGRPKGEAVIDPGIPIPAEAPSFWRAADPDKSAAADRLIPLAGAGRTRAPHLWLLAPEDVEVDADVGVELEDFETAPHGLLWRILHILT